MCVCGGGVLGALGFFFLKKNLGVCVMMIELSDSNSLSFVNVRSALGPFDDPLVCIYMLETLLGTQHIGT